MHENAYQRLLEKGYVSWDRLKSPDELFKHEINLALSTDLDKFFPNSKDKKSLDLGTGAGTVALYLAQKGFDSTGYDISDTAIQMASSNAQKLNLKAKFLVKDINECKTNELFHLVVDSSFLHCVVEDQDRSNCYQFINDSLQTDGYFFLHTMVQSEDMSEMLAAKHLLLENDVLWSTGPDSWEMDWQIIQGQKVFPHRRILSHENLEGEIQKHGFRIIKNKLMDQGKKPKTYTAWIEILK